MSDAPPPGSPRKGEPSIYQRAARELATNPDSPASLRLMSAFNGALRPQQQAGNQLVAALVVLQDDPTDASARAQADAAIAAWERACRMPMPASTLASFEEVARGARDQAQRQPPSLESILGPQEGRTDYGYDLGVDLGGLRGTWHRLWAAMVLDGTMGEAQDLITTLRSEFEGKLGRSLSDAEWRALAAHAERRVISLRAAQGRPNAD